MLGFPKPPPLIQKPTCKPLPKDLLPTDRGVVRMFYLVSMSLWILGYELLFWLLRWLFAETIADSGHARGILIGSILLAAWMGVSSGYWAVYYIFRYGLWKNLKNQKIKT